MKLIHGDCLVEMKNIPDKSINLILTDPPYEFENHGGGKNEFANRDLVTGKIEFISNGFDYDAVFEEFLRICKIPNILIFCSNNQVSKVMQWFESRDLSVTLLIWHKTNPSPLCNGKHISDVEFIVYVRGKGATFNNGTPFPYKSKVFRSPVVSRKERLHPTQKSVMMLEQYVNLHSREGDIVLDCFMGSGTTGVACVNTDRDFIGIELNEEYFKIAERRINDAITEKKSKLFYYGN